MRPAMLRAHVATRPATSCAPAPLLALRRGTLAPPRRRSRKKCRSPPPKAGSKKPPTPEDDLPNPPTHSTTHAHTIKQTQHIHAYLKKQTGPDTAKGCAKIYGCVECEYVAKPTGTKHRTEGAFLQCLACDLAQGYVLNTFTGRCDCAGGFGAPMASGQLTSLWKYVPSYVDDTWSQVENEVTVDDVDFTTTTKPILLPEFVWPGKYRHCALCPAGTYTDGANPIRTRCSFCPRGTTTEGAGCSGPEEDCCTSCAPGWVWNDATTDADGNEIAAGCKLCPAGTWSPGGPVDTEATCEDCPVGSVDNGGVIGAPGLTLNAGAGSVEQCYVLPSCDGAITYVDDEYVCPVDPSYIIKKGYHLEREDPETGEITAVPTTQHYQKKTGLKNGVNGYYCVACPEGTESTSCSDTSGVCKPTAETVTSPTYKKLKETHFKRGYHGDFVHGDEELPGVDPIQGYEEIKYKFKDVVDADDFVPV
jgi:hypothetical protein